MGPQFLIDSNVIIEFLIGNLPSQGVSWLIEKVNNQEHCISPINQIEVLGYNGEPDEMQRAELFINGSKSIPIDSQVVANTILIKRKKKIKLPDAVIAATAITHGLTIVTRNEKDFKDIDGIKTINLHSL
ncbi:type II toxin-antitoxin system VapC family toxin [Neolewinella agarilytica]|uniref:type II toxin-antitoxin system VapC family toxin n=1 Tax=Neolewinella agarilytica TaxID=478744 RepID=UPI0023579FE5|nr:type II toxin-antitoxin system VapC family toxin [Neolewinella agarilytica]